MKTKKTILFSLVSLVILSLAAIFAIYDKTNLVRTGYPDLSDKKYFIAHATGSLDGYVYINSKESLISSLENGYQYIEVDLDYTSDSVLVCVHDWEDFNKSSIPGISWRDSAKFMKVPTLEEFRKRKIYSRFTPLTLEDVISIKQQIPFTLVTDRISNSAALNRYITRDIRNSVMVEAFSEKDYQVLKADGYIPMLSLQLITGYGNCIDFILHHSINNEIEWVVVDYHSSQKFLHLLKNLFNIKIAAYTINSPAYLYDHLGYDIDLVYTDNWNLKKQMNNFQNHTTR